MSEMHFRDYSMSAPGNKTSLYALGIIGIFILALAWINYINLTTTRALERAREVGVRKVMGATNAHLRWQFLGEALLLNLVAALLAFTLVQAARPFLAEIANPLVISNQQVPQFCYALYCDHSLWNTSKWIVPSVGLVKIQKCRCNERVIQKR